MLIEAFWARQALSPNEDIQELIGVLKGTIFSMISDEELLKYWRNENFSGSYRGARIFQVLLKTDENIDVPLSRIYKVLSKDQGCLHKTSVRIL